MWLYCVPVLAAFTVLISSDAIKDYLYQEESDELI